MCIKCVVGEYCVYGWYWQQILVCEFDVVEYLEQY